MEELSMASQTNSSQLTALSLSSAQTEMRSAATEFRALRQKHSTSKRQYERILKRTRACPDSEDLQLELAAAREEVEEMRTDLQNVLVSLQQLCVRNNCQITDYITPGDASLLTQTEYE